MCSRTCLVWSRSLASRTASSSVSTASRYAKYGTLASTMTFLPPGNLTTRSGTSRPSSVHRALFFFEMAVLEHPGHLDHAPELDLAPAPADGSVCAAPSPSWWSSSAALEPARRASPGLQLAPSPPPAASCPPCSATRGAVSQGRRSSFGGAQGRGRPACESRQARSSPARERTGCCCGAASADSVANASRSLTSACSSKVSLSAAALRSASSSAARRACAVLKAVASRCASSSVCSRFCRSRSICAMRFEDSSSRARAAATSARGLPRWPRPSRGRCARAPRAQQMPAPLEAPTASPRAKDIKSIDHSSTRSRRDMPVSPVRTPAAFGRRCIPLGVAPRPNAEYLGPASRARPLPNGPSMRHWTSESGYWLEAYELDKGWWSATRMSSDGGG